MRPLRRRRAVPVDPPVAAGPAEEAELVARVARGDEAAFAELYDRLVPKVYGTVLAVVRDPAQAEEVTQEVMVELWRLAPRHDNSRGSVRAWATTIAHRRAVDRVRSSEAGRVREERDRHLSPLTEPDVAEAVEERIGRDLDRERVRRALESLTETQRESIELAYRQGYTYREVAAVLDVPEGTVKTRIRDGLIRLRDALEVSG